MKTHELARGMEQLARILLAQPNMDLRNLKKALSAEQQSQAPEGIAVNLTTLLGLSKFQKREWLAVINAYDLPIDVRPRDASRDVLGKLLSYLDENEAAQLALLDKSKRDKRAVSHELMKALNVLLEQND